MSFLSFLPYRASPWIMTIVVFGLGLACSRLVATCASRALFWAIDDNKPWIVKACCWLLGKNRRVHSSLAGETPLIAALKQNEPNLTIVQTLLEWWGIHDHRPDVDQSPLFVTAGSSSVQIVELFRCLLKKSSIGLARQRNYNDKTALDVAIQNINCPSNRANDVIDLLTSFNHFGVRPQPNSMFVNSSLLCQMITQEVSLNLVRIVIAAASNCLEDDINQISPLHGVTPLMLLAKTNCTTETTEATMELLVGNGARFELADLNEGSVLHIATRHGNLQFLDAVCTLYANRLTVVPTSDLSGQTPLFYLNQAVQNWEFRGSTSMHEDLGQLVADLLLADIDINAKNQAGDTALTVQVGNGNVPAVRTLVLAGADTSIVDRHGLTPEQYARGCLRSRDNLLRDMLHVLRVASPVLDEEPTSQATTPSQ